MFLDKQPMRIAILGGGVAGVTAALALTDAPDWHMHRRVTLYQLGWRLGGKGASGRNGAVADRIEEHGLHVWGGDYENAFRLIRRVYGELGRREGPIRTWQDAFKPHTDLYYVDSRDPAWPVWSLPMPTNDRVPGDGALSPTGWEWLERIAAFLREHVLGQLRDAAGFLRSGGAHGAEGNWLAEELLDVARRGAATVLDAAAETVGHTLQDLHGRTQALVRAVAAAWDDSLQLAAEGIADTIEGVVTTLTSLLGHLELPPSVKELLDMVALLAVIVRGLVVDRVLGRGFRSIDGLDYRDWLRSHGASVDLTNSPLVMNIYEVLFAYRHGRTDRPAIAAGTALRSFLKTTLDYRGAAIWKMQAGMGDIVFAPIYELLQRRGVRFEFFHRVTDIEPTPPDAQGRQGIAAVHFEVQALLEHDRPYQPLRNVPEAPSSLALPCWPSAPDWSQLKDAADLQGHDLESFWQRPKPRGTLTLHVGHEVDHVVLAIAIGAFPSIAGKLMRASAPFERMVKEVQTVRTAALQLWFDRDLAALGWTKPAPLLGGYAQPLNTWADMAHLLPRETWPAGHLPRDVAYLCGPFDDEKDSDATITDPAIDPDTPQRQKQRLGGIARAWLDRHCAGLWPDAVPVPGATSLDWQRLVVLDGSDGPARLQAQYLRANVDPSERYVLSLPGSTDARLKSDASGFERLVLAGDWTDNGWNTGTVEAAVISGLRAAEAILCEDLGVVE